MELKKMAHEVREIIEKRKDKLELSFIEDEHIYFMKDMNGVIRNDYPSVSKVIKNFYVPFDSESKALEMSNGNKEKAKKLLNEWEKAGTNATSMGSRAHYFLESELVGQYGNYKNVREPIFDCDDESIDRSNSMIVGGKEYIDLMHERGAVLLDTEMVLGDPELGYVGQPDKVWLIPNKNKNSYGFVITDWKTNQERKFQIQHYTKKMLSPFELYYDTALTHYFIQLPLYGKLLLKMLENTKFKDIKLYGCVVVHLKDNKTFTEYKVPQEITETILNINIKNYLKD
jgi:hypothetical protein